MDLRHGTNPHQHPATATPLGRPSIRVVHGEPSLINILDVVGAWQLVREADATLGRPAATSFKHVSPAGAAVAGPTEDVAKLYGLGSTVGELTSAYVRARDADPKSSYGDIAAVSRPVDAELADLLRRVVSDGIVAPGYEPGVVATLAAKKGGRFLVVEADPEFVAPELEVREVYGLRLIQPRDSAPLTLAGHDLPPNVVDDLLLGLITVRHTQSNSVAYVRDGVILGIGAGQQSRIDCTRLAGAKTDLWWQRRDVEVPTTGSIQERISYQLSNAPEGPVQPLDGVSFASDGALPFVDNVEEARLHGVRYIAEPGGSSRSADVRAACDRYKISLIQTGLRLFRH